MTTKDLIYDDEYLRECPHNIAKLGFWGTWDNFYSYKRCFKLITGLEIWRHFVELVIDVLNLVIIIILFPVLPLTQAFFKYKRAKIEVEKHLLEKACRQLLAYKKSKKH